MLVWPVLRAKWHSLSGLETGGYYAQGDTAVSGRGEPMVKE